MAVAEKAKALKAAGRDIISFSIGVPNFLPGRACLRRRRAKRWTKDSGQYGSNRGADVLLDAFLDHIERAGLTGYTRANIATGIGAKHILYNLAEALLDEGDTIAFAVPYWTTYHDIADIVNAKTLAPALPGQPELQAHPGAAGRRAGSRSRRCSCSTIRTTRPAWSITRTKSPPWPTCW